MDTVKVVIIGPESTGKSTLTKQLAEHFDAPYVPEYARTYLEESTKDSYDWEDLEAIAAGQVIRVQEALKEKPRLLFCDTDLVTLHIWSLDKFDRPLPDIEKLLKEQKPHLYLLCKPDIDWQPDGLREDSTRRTELFSWNAWMLESLQAKYCTVGGMGVARFNSARKCVNQFLAKR